MKQQKENFLPSWRKLHVQHLHGIVKLMYKAKYEKEKF